MGTQRTLRFASEDGTTAVVTVTAADERRARLGAIENAMFARGFYSLERDPKARPRFMPYWACVAIGFAIPALAIALLLNLVDGAGGSQPLPRAPRDALLYYLLPSMGVMCTAFFALLERQVRTQHARRERLLALHGGPVTA